MDKLHAEMERTVSKRIDNKLVDYQISLSDNFYKKYLSYYNCPYTQAIVNHIGNFSKIYRITRFTKSSEILQKSAYRIDFPNWILW